MKMERKEIFKYFKRVFLFRYIFCTFANSKSINMATIILEYDARNAIAKKTINFIMSLGIFTEKTSKTSFEKSQEDIKKGRVFSANNGRDLIGKCLR